MLSIRYDAHFDSRQCIRFSPDGAARPDHRWSFVQMDPFAVDALLRSVQSGHRRIHGGTLRCRTRRSRHTSSFNHAFLIDSQTLSRASNARHPRTKLASALVDYPAGPDGIHAGLPSCIAQVPSLPARTECKRCRQTGRCVGHRARSKTVVPPSLGQRG